MADPVAILTDSQTGYPFTVQTCGNYLTAGCSNLNLTFTQVTPADSTAPTTPPGVTAVAAGPKQVNLGWGTSTDNTAVAGYAVYRNGTQIARTQALSFIDAVPAGTAYSYTVAAYDYKNNLSSQSSAVDVTTPTSSDTTAPSGPTNVQFAAQDAHSVTVRWSPATDNVGVTRYMVSGGSGTYNVAAGTTSFTDRGLAANTMYRYYVYAFDGAGNYTYADTSSTVYYTPKEGTLPPSRPTIISHEQVTSTRDDVFFSVSADVAGSVSYRYFRDGRLVGTVSGHPGISDARYPNDGAAHYDYVQAVDAYGNISQSGLANAWAVGALGSSTDTTAPSASINSPASGATTSGTLTVGMSASDNVIVSGLELYVDGQLANAAVPTLYGASVSVSVSWDTTQWGDGTHSLAAKAYDGNGNNVGTSAPTTVTVSNGATADTTPPTSPSNLTAAGSSPTQVSLGWTASTDNIGVTGYSILRNGSAIATVGNVTTYADSSVTASTTYSYQVEAIDAAGNVSAASNMASATTPAPPDTSAPTAPTNLVGWAASSSQVNLSWSPSTDNVGIAGYWLYRNGGQVATVTGTTWSDAGVSGSTTYSYAVVAFDAAGNTSATSNTVSITTPAPPGSGGASGALAGIVSNTSGAAVAGAKVSISTGGKSTNCTTSSTGSYSFSNLPPGTYTVTASAKGYKTQSTTLTVTAGSTTTANITLK